jgi:hypothetical protein
MEAEDIRAIPKSIQARILKLDIKNCPAQQGASRLYSYLTTVKGELVKITVAVKTKRHKQYVKQVAVHGVKSGKCLVKDMEYNGIGGMGYRIGWYDEGLSDIRQCYEYSEWATADSKYYNPYAMTVNKGFVSNFPEYKYSEYKQFRGKCIIEYLKLYVKYPQVEYLLKLDLFQLHDSVTVLRLIAKEKAFCKWLIAHKDEVNSSFYHIPTIIQAYKSGKPLKQVHEFLKEKKQFDKKEGLQPLQELFKKELEQFFIYIKKQNTDYRSYLDYLIACHYLGLDMSLPKNRYPHDFKRRHDIRIDQYHTAKILADVVNRPVLYAQFAAVAEKYAALQNIPNGGYAVMIAMSPAELMREGDALSHCVGKMDYEQKVLREESLIFFVRDSNTPDTPFVTVEYSLKSKKVLQCYGYKSLPPDKAVTEFVHQVWLPFANKIINKINKNKNIKEDKAA